MNDSLENLRWHSKMRTPLGEILLVANTYGLTGIYLPAHKPGDIGTRDDHRLLTPRRQLTEYFTGDRREFDLSLAATGTEFQQSVWKALQQIPYGETASYKDIATWIGKPSAVRAVGLANGKNPLSIVVPCHRVIGANGKLVGYGGGVGAKGWLLDHERKNSRTTWKKSL